MSTTRLNDRFFFQTVIQNSPLWSWKSFQKIATVYDHKKVSRDATLMQRAFKKTTITFEWVLLGVSMTRFKKKTSKPPWFPWPQWRTCQWQWWRHFQQENWELSISILHHQPQLVTPDLTAIDIIITTVWCFRNPANSPVEVGRLSHYLQEFYTSQVVVWDVLPSTVCYQPL